MCVRLCFEREFEEYRLCERRFESSKLERSESDQEKTMITQSFLNDFLHQYTGKSIRHWHSCYSFFFRTLINWQQAKVLSPSYTHTQQNFRCWLPFDCVHETKKGYDAAASAAADDEMIFHEKYYQKKKNLSSASECFNVSALYVTKYRNIDDKNRDGKSNKIEKYKKDAKETNRNCEWRAVKVEFVYDKCTAKNIREYKKKSTSATDTGLCAWYICFFPDHITKLAIWFFSSR